MRICPRCKGILGERPALSRRDGKTDMFPMWTFGSVRRCRKVNENKEGE